MLVYRPDGSWKVYAHQLDFCVAFDRLEGASGGGRAYSADDRNSDCLPWYVRSDEFLYCGLINCALVITENGVRLRLNIVDTPGFADMVNNENW